MTRKALIVAVWDYGRDAEKLTAPEYELQQWQDLLGKAPYNFEIISLPDKEATREAVLQGLSDLLKDAKKDDQLLFIFEGHGSIIDGRDGGKPEQALIASPLRAGLEEAAIRESDVQALFAQHRPPHGTDITFVISSCHSDDYGPLLRLRKHAAATSVAATAIALATRPLVNRASMFQDVRAFGEFAEQAKPYERPVILAATGKYDQAYEVTYGGRRRSLFTARLIDSLRQVRDTFRNIRDNINPLHPEFPEQVARLGGNESRWDEKFPGEPGEKFAAANEAVASDSESTSAATLNMRVLGLATFVNARSENAPYKARIVLPYDEGQYVPAIDRHFACIEIATYETLSAPTGPLASKWTKRYTKDDVEYTRWSLNGYTVTIETGDPDAPFRRSPDFQAYVPKLTVIAPELQFTDPHPQCFDPAPLLNRFATFVNLPGGYVDVGPPHAFDTKWERRYSGEKTFGPIRTRRDVKVTVPVITEDVTIALRPYLDPTKADLIVKLKPGATILIANAREEDITGTGAGNIPREQFLLYYKLAPAPLADPPLPFTTGIPSDDCTVTDYP